MKSVISIIAVFSAMIINCCAQNSNKLLLLKNATIIDGDANIKPRKGSLLIKNGIIEGIYDDQSKINFKNVEIIDCTGKFITPGLMDSHVHLATGNLSNIEKAHLATDSILLNFIRHGVTTVRDMAGYAPYLAYYKTNILAGKTVGPDIYYAAQFAGPGYFKMMKSSKKEDQDLGKTAWSRSISAKLEVKSAIKDAKAAGATGIKIYADLSKELITEITKEAHKQGLMAWAHGAVFPAKPMDDAKAGVNSMSHANDLVFQALKGDTIDLHTAWAKVYKGLRMDSATCDQLLLEMKKNNVYLDATVFHAENNKMVNALIITRRANELGVKIVTGTDWVYPTKNENLPLLNEMKLLVEKCGLDNLTVIQSATLNGAQVTGLNDRGVVRKGKKADLLVLSNDPTKNLEALFSPEKVLKNGAIIF